LIIFWESTNRLFLYQDGAISGEKKSAININPDLGRSCGSPKEMCNYEHQSKPIRFFPLLLIFDH